LAAGVRIMAPLPEVAMNGVGAEIRGLCQEIYLQDLVLSLYGVYAPRLRDPEGKRLIESYLQAEIHRQKRLERYLAPRRASPAPAIGAVVVAAGSAYGRLPRDLGTRVMLRMTLSSSRRAARRACGLLGAAADPELVNLSALRARNEGELSDDLCQHLIETAP